MARDGERVAAVFPVKGTKRGTRIEEADERVTLSQIESVQTSSAISSSFCSRSSCPSRNTHTHTRSLENFSPRIDRFRSASETPLRV